MAIFTALLVSWLSRSVDSFAVVQRTMASTTRLAASNIDALPATHKRLFWVRHGEVINPGGDRPVYYGAMDVPLSELGQLEAQAAADYLSQYSLDLVVASPLQRAIYGAQQVLAQQSSHLEQHTEVLILEGLKELDRGAWCGLTKAEIGPENLARFDACDETVTPHGGESYPFLKERVLAARDTILQQLQDGQSAAIVSHLQVTRCALSDALGIPTSEMAELKVATASVTCIDYSSDGTTQTVQFQSYKPDVGLAVAKDGAN